MTASSGLDPETITTAEQLDALPVGSVVRCDDAEGIGLNVAERQPEGWQYVGSALHFTSRQLASDEVPFALLYRPDRPSEAARLRSDIEALADEWERDRRYSAAGNTGFAPLLGDHVSALRALLSADDEAVK